MTEREAIERADREATEDAAWSEDQRRQADRDARTGGLGRRDHYRRRAARLDLAEDRPLRVRLGGHAIVERWPAWYCRRVERAREAKARAVFVTSTPTVRVPAAWTPTPGRGRASRTERRRRARKASSRSSDDDGPGDEPAPRKAGRA